MSTAEKIQKLDLRDERGCFNYDLIIELMNIEKNELAEMIDYNRTSLRKEPASPKLIATLTPYVRILTILWDYFDGDAVKISKWLHQPQRDWLYLSAIEMMRRKKTDKVVDFLISQLDKKADIWNG